MITSTGGHAFFVPAGFNFDKGNEMSKETDLKHDNEQPTPSFTILIDPPNSEPELSSVFLLYSLRSYVDLLSEENVWEDEERIINIFRIMQPSLRLIIDRLMDCKDEGEEIDTALAPHVHELLQKERAA